MRSLLFIILTVVVLASFFASVNPDGLEKVAEDLGFIAKASQHTAPLPDYTTPGLQEGGLSTALSGIAGVLIILSLFWLTASIIKKWNKGTKTLALMLAALLLASSTAYAARPLVTDDYGTVELNKFELETGINLIRPMSSHLYESGLVVQLKRGMTNSFDLGLELPYNIDLKAFADAVLHAKLKIFDLGGEEGLTLRGDIKLTNGNALTGLGSGYLDYGAMFILTKKTGNAKLHANFGYTVIGDPGNCTSDDTLLYNAALEYPIKAGNIDFVSEYTAISCQAQTLANLQIGGRLYLSDMARLDAGYSLAMNDASRNIMTLGLTSTF